MCFLIFMMYFLPLFSGQVQKGYIEKRRFLFACAFMVWIRGTADRMTFLFFSCDIQPYQRPSEGRLGPGYVYSLS